MRYISGGLYGALWEIDNNWELSAQFLELNNIYNALSSMKNIMSYH